MPDLILNMNCKMTQYGPSIIEFSPSKVTHAEVDEEGEVNPEATAEHVRNLIEDTKKLLIPDVRAIVGAWGLIDNDPVTGDLRQEDMDVVFLLTADCYYAAQERDSSNC
jgi:hypothetical protein